MWQVSFSGKAAKMFKKLPEDIQSVMNFLRSEIEQNGPYRSNWPNYSSLKKPFYHCHLKKGRPTYVAVWMILDKKKKHVEVTYVGTHEGAPY